MTQFTTELLSS